jgi:hypothetical protein
LTTGIAAQIFVTSFVRSHAREDAFMSTFDKIAKALGGPQIPYSAQENKISAASRTIGKAVLLAALAGIIALVIWAWGLAKPAEPDATLNFSVVFGANLLVGLAAAAAGAVFGFIFGIPRTLNPADRAAVAAAASQEGAVTHTVMAANTNLERISDWLSTLLIGATLVQIKEIAAWVGALGKDLVKTGTIANDALVPVIVILFFSLSFLGVYLITRLYWTAAFMQTLAMLTGTAAPSESIPTASPTASSSNATAALSGKLTAAFRSDKAEELAAARIAFDNAQSDVVDRDNPALNANLATVLMKLLKTGAAQDRLQAVADLKAAIERAKRSVEQAAALKKRLADGSLTTGTPQLDNELKANLDA